MIGQIDALRNYYNWIKEVITTLFLIQFLGGEEHIKESYEVLVADVNAKFEWIPSSKGQVPDRAIQSGHTSSGEPLYICRVVHEGVLTPGKIHPSYKSCFIAYGSKEHSYQFDYEILVATE